MENIALVLEGGGMRCGFTAGVLDCFMEHKITFPYTIAVSSGAIVGLSYMSEQLGRNRDIMVNFIEKKKCIGIKNYLQKRAFVNFQAILQEYDEEELPFDFEVYRRNPSRFIIATTNCQTGKAIYFEEKFNKERHYSLFMAYTSLPLYCPTVYIDGIPMCNGGIADAIPFQKAIEDGFNKFVFILTHYDKYCKNKRKNYILPFLLQQYPDLKYQLQSQNYRYNQIKEKIGQIEEEGRALIISLFNEKNMGTFTSHPNIIQKIYEEGYQQAKEQIPLLSLLNEIK